MLVISADRINRFSPYFCTQLDDLSVTFTTDEGVCYDVGFTKDAFIFDDGAYFCFISNKTAPKAKDDKLYQTIVAIFEEFFTQEDGTLVVMYICDTTDAMQQFRSRLFRIWLSRYSHSEEYTLHSESNEDNGIVYYYGILLRKDNPQHDSNIRSFHDFLIDI